MRICETPTRHFRKRNTIIDETLQKTLTAHIDAAHNEYLNVMYHQGIFALLSYLAALLCALIGYLRSAPKNAAAAILGAGVLCYAIQAFFNISMYLTAPYFWLCLGMLDAENRKTNERMIG